MEQPKGNWLREYRGFFFYTLPSGNTEVVNIRNKDGNSIHDIAFNIATPSALNKAIESAKVYVDEMIDAQENRKLVKKVRKEEHQKNDPQNKYFFGKYHFNEHGVCTNPTRVFYLDTNKIRCVLKLANTAVGWAIGYELQVKGSSVGAGGSSCAPAVNRKSEKYYNEKNEAITACIDRALKYFEGNKLVPAADLKQIQAFASTIEPVSGFIYGWHKGGSKTEILYVKVNAGEWCTTPNKKEAKVFKSIPEIIDHWLSVHAIPADYVNCLTNGYIKYFSRSGDNYLAISPNPLFFKFSKDSQTLKSKPTMATELKMVKLSDIVPSQTNNLQREAWELEEPALKELSESISQNGVISPVLLRHNGKPGKFYLVCGERRFKASQLAGVKEIPAFIRELTEEGAFDLQITENLQRKDVHPMKEAQAYKALMDVNPEKNTVQELAHRFGKGPEYIAQRLSFNNLIAEMKKEFMEGKMQIGHALAFARLQEGDQRECFVKCKIKYGPSEGHYEPVKTIDAFVKQNVVRELKKAAFNPNDAQLVESAGSCNTCPKRSGQNLLFADVKEKDRCFDGACFQMKTSLHLINKIAELRENNPDMAIVASWGSQNHISSVLKKYMTKNGIRVLKEHDEWRSAAKTDKGAVKALVIAGSNVGETTYVKLIKHKDEPKTTSVKGEGAKNTPAHFDELIANERQLLKETVKEITEEVHEQMAERAKSLKPYAEPDNTDLNKYELAIFYMELCSSIGHVDEKKIMAIIKKIPVDKSLSKEEQLVEQWALAPQPVINFLFRCVLTNENIEWADTSAGIAFRKAVGTWKGVNLAQMEKDAAARIEKTKQDSEKKIAALQQKKKELASKSTKPSPKK